MSLLFLPIQDTIIIPAQISKEMSDEEFNAEMESMFMRSQLASAVLNQGIGLEDLIDCVQTQGIDTDSYINSLEEIISIF
jgi:alpha-acetolactate decarboxylase